MTEFKKTNEEDQSKESGIRQDSDQKKANDDLRASGLNLLKRSRLLRVWNRYFRLWNFSDLLLLGGIFSLGVLILLLHLFTWGASVWEESERLRETEATVMECYLHSKKNLKGVKLYRPEVLISYEVDGQPHLMRTYDRRTLTAEQGFVFDKETAEEILKTFEVNRKIPCWYSVDNPDRVILQKDPNYWGWIFLVIPLVLISFGAAGLILKIRIYKGSKERKAVDVRRESRYPTVPDSQIINESPGTQLAFRLPIAIFPTFHVILLLIFAVIWNLLAWMIFIYLFSRQSNGFELLSVLLFGLLFCGSGLIFFPRMWRLVRNSLIYGATILEISDHPIVPSRKHRLAMVQNGPLQATSCDISIICEELARYRQGTDTITNHKEVYRQQLYWKENIAISAGASMNEEFFLKLPRGVMHTFQTEHNEIRWKLVVRIIVRDSTVVQRSCPVIVLPYTIRSDMYDFAESEMN